MRTRAVLAAGLLLLAVAAAAQLAAAQLDAVYDRADPDVLKAARAAVASGDLSDAYQGARLLQLLGARPPMGACAPVAAALGGAADVEAVYHGVAALRALNCDVKVKQAQRALVLEALESARLDDLFFGSMAGTLSKKKSLKVSWPGVVARVGKLMATGGTFKNFKKDTKPNALNAGRAFRVLATAAPKLAADSEAMDTVLAVADNIGPLFAAAEGSEDTVLALAGEDKLAATSLAMFGALELADAARVEVDVSVEQLAAFAAFFLSQRSAAAAAVGPSFHVAQGLVKLAANSLAMPLAVRVLTPTLADASAGAMGDLRVAVTDVFGEPVGAVSVAVTALPRAGAKDVVVLDAVAMEPTGSGAFRTAFVSAEGVGAAVYDLELAVRPEDAAYAAPEVVHRLVKVTTVASYGTAEVQVTSTPRLSTTKTKATAKFPRAVKATVRAGEGQHLHVALSITSATSGAPLRPHQVFVRLTNAETGKATLFVAGEAKAKKKGGLTHHLALDIGNREALHDAAAPGEYALAVLVGDAILDNPAVWELATVELSPPRAPAKAPKPLYAEPLLHESDTTRKALPEIAHVFRTPDPRPSTPVALLFTALCVAPFFVMLGALRSRGANLKGLPRGAMLYVVGFHGSLGAILVLFAVYWVGLTMFQTLAYLCPLAVSAVFFGHGLLSTLARGGGEKVKPE